MRIAVYAKVLSEEQPTGIGVYTYNLLKALSRIDGKNEYTLYSNEPIIKKIEAGNFREKILKFPRFWSYLRLPFEFLGGRYDVLFVPKEMIPPLIRPKTAVVCYDLMGTIFPERIALDGKIHFWMAVNYALKRADRIIAISEATKKDIIRQCGVPPEKVSVTHLGYDDRLYRPCADEGLIGKVKARYGIDSPYLINTSSVIWYRKNIPGAVKAFHASRAGGASGLKLVITGKRGEAYEEVSRLVKSLGLEKDVIFTGYLPLEDMPVLLSGASALFFPSLDEGFGLPLVEAMACGCPVVTSNVSAMPEVAGGAAMLVDPYNIEEMAAAIGKVAADGSLRDAMRRKGFERVKHFSWEMTARRTLEIFEGLG